jgi:hypothetical protein
VLAVAPVEREFVLVDHDAEPRPVRDDEIEVAILWAVRGEPLGTGLTPGDASSVAPNGIPVGEFAEPVAMPSGEVSPIVGVGVAVPTCALATLQTKSAGRTATINENLIGVLRLQTASSRS